jgi:hypothetical protein
MYVGAVDSIGKSAGIAIYDRYLEMQATSFSVVISASLWAY